MASGKQIVAHSDFARVVVQVGGMPVSMYSEVEITLKRPAKLDNISQAAWELVRRNGAETVTVELVPVARAAE